MIHGDLGPDHLICHESGLVGVIDWSDACINDPPVDYVSLLHDFGPGFAAEVGDAAGAHLIVR